MRFVVVANFEMFYQDRDKLQRIHLGDTVEELKRFNARRKLKGAVQAVAGGIAMDPLCGADTDASMSNKISPYGCFIAFLKPCVCVCVYVYAFYAIFFH